MEDIQYVSIDDIQSSPLKRAEARSTAKLEEDQPPPLPPPNLKYVQAAKHMSGE